VLLPIGHDRDTLRRPPWSTFAIIVLSFAATGFAGTGVLRWSAAVQAAERAFAAHAEAPYLRLDPRLDGAAFEGIARPDRSPVARLTSIPAPADRATLAAQQRQLDALAARAVDLLERHPLARLGVVPAAPRPSAWLTHLFVHAGWLTAIGGMLVLYLAGPFLEDVWGRGGFLVLYLGGGLTGAAAAVLAHPESLAPLAGSAGAVAAVLGAFVVRWGSTRVRFLYGLGFMWLGTFEAPARVVLAVWIAEQAGLAMLGRGGSAWMRIAGFAFGAALALVVRSFDLEARWIEPRLAARLDRRWIERPAIARALAASQRGDRQSALDLLRERLERDPADRDAALAYWEESVAADLAPQAVPQAIAVVEHDLRAGDVDQALDRWQEMKRRVPDRVVAPELSVRIAEALRARGNDRDAAQALREALLRGGERLSATLALRIAALAPPEDRALARAAAVHAVAHPDAGAAERALASEILRTLAARSEIRSSGDRGETTQ